jgi:hypothetical protein
MLYCENCKEYLLTQQPSLYEYCVECGGKLIEKDIKKGGKNEQAKNRQMDGAMEKAGFPDTRV